MVIGNSSQSQRLHLEIISKAMLYHAAAPRMLFRVFRFFSMPPAEWTSFDVSEAALFHIAALKSAREFGAFITKGNST